MNSRKKKRHRSILLLDALVRQFPDITRDDLYRYVMCGEVYQETQKLTDPRRRVDPDLKLSIVRERFVSRGGDKLLAALKEWKIQVSRRRWLDAGASTGGFTDCLLQNGALLVHAVDVGYNQLDYRLRRDSRVRVLERTNILQVDRLDPVPDAAVCDLSFRSLRGVLRHILDLTSEGWGIALLKPQFEVAAEVRWGNRDANDAGEGIVPEDRRDEVIDGVIEALERDEGVTVLRRMASPIPGRRGNREELLLVRYSPPC